MLRRTQITCEFVQRVMADEHAWPRVQGAVTGVEFLDGRATACGVSLAESLLEVSVQQLMNPVRHGVSVSSCGQEEFVAQTGGIYSPEKTGKDAFGFGQIASYSKGQNPIAPFTPRTACEDCCRANTTQRATAMRKGGHSTTTVPNWCNRPVADYPDEQGTCGDHQKAALGGTCKMGQERL
jgi:hypothetical protein